MIPIVCPICRAPAPCAGPSQPQPRCAAGHRFPQSGAVRFFAGGEGLEHDPRPAIVADWLITHYAAFLGRPGAAPPDPKAVYRSLTDRPFTEAAFDAILADSSLPQVVADIDACLNGVGEDFDADMRAFTAEALALRAGDRLLDAGCSTGRNFLGAPEGVACLGVDLSATALLIGERLFQGRGAGPAPVFCGANLLSLPLADGSVDKIQSFVVLGLTPIQAALAELRRVLRPGGRLVFTIEGVGYWRELWERSSGDGRAQLGLLRWRLGRHLQEAGLYWQGAPVVGRLAGLVQYAPEMIAREAAKAGFGSVTTTVVRAYQGEPRVIGVVADKP